jgi:hypothetical protein
MAHVHDRPVVVERESDAGAGMGLGMVLGIILAIALGAGLLWFMFAGTLLRPATETPTNSPTINVNPPNITVPDNITITPANPPQQQPGNGSDSSGN